MKGAKTGEVKAGRSAEDWVQVAKEFGDNCQALQSDKKLSEDQKLEKQKVLAQKMTKEIEADPHLKKEEKKLMVASIDSYMKEWTKMHELMKSAMDGQKKSAKK